MRFLTGLLTGIVATFALAGTFTGGTPFICRAFYVCDHQAVTGLFVGLGFLVIMLGLILLGAAAIYWDAKSKAPPITSSDIKGIIDEARQRAARDRNYTES
jgi:hypothetical protein